MKVLKKWLLSRWTRALIGPSIIAAGAFMPEPTVAIPVSLVGVMLTGTSTVFSDRQKDEGKARAETRAFINDLLGTAVDVLLSARPGASEPTLRANIMLIDQGGLMRIAYSTAGYPDYERNQTWGPGEGCAGYAWENATTVWAPRDVELPVNLGDAEQTSRPWNMTKAQIRATAGHVASVLSVPILKPGTYEVGAVFNLDDRKTLEESLLDDEDVLSSIETVAMRLGTFLARMSFSFPSETPME